jgi:hypothetical protein
MFCIYSQQTPQIFQQTISPFSEQSTLTAITVDSSDITAQVSREQKHYFHLWGLQKTRDFFRYPTRENNVFTLPLGKVDEPLSSHCGGNVTLQPQRWKSSFYRHKFLLNMRGREA